MCITKWVQGLPEVPLDDAAIAAIFKKMTEKERSRFEQLLDYECDKFKYAGMDRGLMIAWIANLEDVPKTKVYPLEAYLTKSGCEAEGINRGERSPIVHLIADAPCTRQDYPEMIIQYLNVAKKDASLWTNAINAKSTEGLTLLDYLYRLIVQNEQFNSKETQGCADFLVKFACKTGGVYSFHKDKMSCKVDAK